MLKKAISYTDYNGNDVTEDFYFNYTKLEIMELLQLEDLEGKIKLLTKTENASEAYAVFKDLILRAYGVKSDDGKRFVKSDELRQQFEASPAMSEMIFEFLERPELGADFIQAALPAKLVAEAKKNQDAAGPVAIETTSAPVLNEEASKGEKTLDDYTKLELLDLPQEDFDRLAGTDANKMPHHVLIVAMQRKNAAK